MIHLVCLCGMHESCVEDMGKMSIVKTTTDYDEVTCPRCLDMITE